LRTLAIINHLSLARINFSGYFPRWLKLGLQFVFVRGDFMSEEMECMCQQCGVSIYIPADLISLEDPANTEVKMLSSLHVCEQCGGQLALVGKAGDEPHYRLK